MVNLWMRHETVPTERRAPISPADARALIQDGVGVTVEDSPQRVFPTPDYAAAGCRVVEAGTWPDAPDDEYIIGLKEPAPEPVELRHRHVFFGHAYKGQKGAGRLLRRFVDGGGSLLDIEYLTNDEGRRLAAFGFWAGYVGAALAVLHHRGRLASPLRPRSKPALDAALATPSGAAARALVIGALGRCGTGAREALAVAGIPTTCWDIAETRRLDRAALLDHEILVNAVFATEPGPAFLEPADLDRPGRRLTVIADVTCDITSDCNRLQVYDSLTDWERPARRLRTGQPALDIVAIDNLPSLVPYEASLAFSADLLPQLKSLAGWTSPWQRCLRTFQAACDLDTTTRKEIDV